MTGHISKAHDALMAAQLLLDAGHLGSAANRAYYAFFHAAQAAVAHVAGINPSTIKTHNGLRRLFELRIVKPGMIALDIATHFRSVESTRIVADYGDEALQRDEVVAALDRARVFVSACEKLLEGRQQ